MSFKARYANKCANGHQIQIDDYIAINEYGQVLCTQCPEFTTGHKAKEVVYSNKFCPECSVEISLSGNHECW